MPLKKSETTVGQGLLLNYRKVASSSSTSQLVAPQKIQIILFRSLFMKMHLHAKKKGIINRNALYQKFSIHFVMKITK